MKKSNYLRRCFLMLVMSPLLLTTCYPDGPDDVDDLDLVLTSYDQSFNFSNARTYYLIDSINHITSSGASSSARINRESDADILNQIATDLNNLGYTRITDISGNKPDLVITTTAWSVENIDVYYDYWYDYWYWWEGWNYWYPWLTPSYYPWGIPYVSSYTTGTLLIEMLNPNAPIMPGAKIPLIWTGALNGALTNDPSYNESRVLSGVDKAFNQSTYLRHSE